jgi:hypothetical protein
VPAVELITATGLALVGFAARPPPRDEEEEEEEEDEVDEEGAMTAMTVVLLWWSEPVVWTAIAVWTEVLIVARRVVREVVMRVVSIAVLLVPPV